MRREVILTTFLILLAMATTISAQSLTYRQKHLATIAALEAQGDLVRLEPAIIEALDGGVTINEVKEALSQLYAYTGFPRSLNALGVLDNILSSPREVRRGLGMTVNLGYVQQYGTMQNFQRINIL